MKKALATLWFLSIVQAGLAQVPYFESYSLRKKNDDVQINAIFQDRTGFVWVGTSKGLFLFDGINVEHYPTSNENITAIAEDSTGRTWFGDVKGQIYFLENNTVHLFNPKEGGANAPISDLLFDRKGNLWFSTLNDGLYHFTNDRLYRVDEAEGMPDLYIYDLTEDAKGRIWAGTDGGAAVCTLNGNKVTIDVINYDDGLPDNIIKKIIYENDSTVWFATEDEGIIRYNPGSATHRLLTENQWPYGTVTDVILKGNKLWIACPQKGIIVMDRETGYTNLYTPEDVPGLSSIKVMMKDREGSIWTGSKTGLMRTPGDDLEYLNTPDPNGSPNVLAVTADTQNTIWFSTKDGLFKRKINSRNIVMPLANTSYRSFTVISLYTDPAGYIWAGLYGEGVLRIDSRSGKVQYLNRELRNGNILCITGEANVVWLATLGGSTRITYAANGKLDIKNYSSDDGLISDFVYQVFPDQAKTWFATDGKGLGLLDEKGFHQFDRGLPSAVIYGIAKDGNGALWVNVQSNGVYKFDGTAFHALDSSLVLRDNNVHSLSADRSGNIVVMHDAGMDVIDIHNKTIHYLGEEVGVRNQTANLNAVGRDAAGNILFGTNTGILKYSGDPEQWKSRPKPEIETVSVFDKPVEGDLLTKLSYDENNITIAYTGLWYKNPRGLYFRYTLENYDRDWIASGNRAITYSRLPPGSYKFRVKVSESADFTNAGEASVSVTIHPPFWQTTSFYIAAIVIALGTIYVFIKYSERKLRRDNEVLESTVQLRTIEIRHQKDDIQAKSEEISAQSEEILQINENLEAMVRERTVELERKNKALEEYAFINAHKLRSPVATILGLVNLISKTKLDEEGEEINRRLKGTANELDRIVSSITKAIERGDKPDL